MRIRDAVLTTTLLAGFVLLPAAAAAASPSDSFGSHVRACATHFSGGMNPGMHRGAAGWDGLPCP